MWGCENEEDEWKHWLIVKDGGGKQGGGLAGRGSENWPQPQSLTFLAGWRTTKQTPVRVCTPRGQPGTTEDLCRVAEQHRQHIACVRVLGNVFSSNRRRRVSFVGSRGLLEMDARSWNVIAKLKEWKSGVSEVDWGRDGLLLLAGRNFGAENLTLQSDSCKMLEAALLFCSVTQVSNSSKSSVLIKSLGEGEGILLSFPNARSNLYAWYKWMYNKAVFQNYMENRKLIFAPLATPFTMIHCQKHFGAWNLKHFSIPI